MPIDVLLNNDYIHRKINTSGQSVEWAKVKWIKYKADSPGKMFYKNTFKKEEPFHVLQLSRTPRSKPFPSKSSITQLAPINKFPIPLPRKKVSDLKFLSTFLSDTSKTFYQSLANSEETEDILPGERSDEEFK